MNFEWDEWRARFVLEALRTLEEKWTSIIQSTEDEDIQSDYSNDVGLLQSLHESFEEAATEAFGPRVKDFSRELIS